MKCLTIIVATLVITLSGCVTTTPTTKESVLSNMIVEHDEFKNESWIKSDTYSNHLENNPKLELLLVDYSMRALYKDGAKEPEFIQIYAKNSQYGGWRFFRSAIGQDGEELPFISIDRKVESQSGGVATIETFGIEVSMDYLRKMSSSDWRVKVYGKNGRGVFTVPKTLSSAFLSKIESLNNQP